MLPQIMKHHVEPTMSSKSRTRLQLFGHGKDPTSPMRSRIESSEMTSSTQIQEKPKLGGADHPLRNSMGASFT